MITPYPPPAGPRVELLRVRRVDPTQAIERSGPAPVREPAEEIPAARLARDRAEFSAEALALLARDLARANPSTDERSIP